MSSIESCVFLRLANLLKKFSQIKKIGRLFFLENKFHQKEHIYGFIYEIIFRMNLFLSICGHL